MNTYIRGEKIKEGSIPFSALSEEIKNNMGGANWDSKEGEAGYIENKPFTNRTLVWEKSFTQEELEVHAQKNRAVYLMTPDEPLSGPIYATPNLFMEISISETVNGRDYTFYFKDYFPYRDQLEGTSYNDRSIMIPLIMCEPGLIHIELPGIEHTSEEEQNNGVQGHYTGTLNYFTVKYYLDNVILDRILTAEDEAEVAANPLDNTYIYDASNDPSFLDGEFTYYVNRVCPEYPNRDFTSNGKFKVKGHNVSTETGGLKGGVIMDPIACLIDQTGIWLGHKDPENPIISPEGHIRLIICKSKKLDSHYISDGVIKTTEQTLSDDAKKQALMNLGIDEGWIELFKSAPTI